MVHGASVSHAHRCHGEQVPGNCRGRGEEAAPVARANNHFYAALVGACLGPRARSGSRVAQRAVSRLPPRCHPRQHRHTGIHIVVYHHAALVGRAVRPRAACRRPLYFETIVVNHSVYELSLGSARPRPACGSRPTGCRWRWPGRRTCSWSTCGDAALSAGLTPCQARAGTDSGRSGIRREQLAAHGAERLA